MTLCVNVHTQQTPKIEAVGEDITLKGKRVFVTRANADTGQMETPSQVATQSDLLFLNDELSADIASANFQTTAALAANLSAVNKELSGALRDAMDQIGQMGLRNGQLQSEIKTLATALDTRLPPSNITCGPYTLTNGVAVGLDQHTSPGAVKTLKCNDGFALTADNTFVICGGDGKWSDNKQSQCASNLTSAPTLAPTTSDEVVTCCAAIDNRLYEVYVDGHQVRQLDTTRNGYLIPGSTNPPSRFRFSSSSKVLGFRGKDSECGCACGQISLICSTPSGTGPWNMQMPGTGGKLGELHVDRRVTIHTRYNGPNRTDAYPAWDMDNRRGTYSLPDFGVQFAPASADGKKSDEFLKRLKISKVCPKVPKDTRTVSGMCGGTSTAYKGTPESRTEVNWWVRFDSRKEQ